MNTFMAILKDRNELSVRYDPKTASIWLYLNPKNCLGFPKSMLEDIYHVQLSIINHFKIHNNSFIYPIRYVIFASQIPNIFNLGGDLNMFLKMIQKQDRLKFLEYAQLAVKAIYLNARNLELPIITISLIEGQALGGGFETALSSNILIAEEGVKMGFPDIKFNLFPGIGAYSLLARITSPSIAENIISSGKIYSSNQLYEMNIIHKLCKPNKGREAVEEYIKKNDRYFIGLQAIQNMKSCYQPLHYKELMDIAEIWVDTALNLTQRDLKMMHRLANAQNQQIVTATYKLRTKHDRRWNVHSRVKYEKRKNFDRRLMA